ncbi:MAG: hypothetical protein ACJARD_001562, partial [Alphaproteobacteria bacterium]
MTVGGSSGALSGHVNTANNALDDLASLFENEGEKAAEAAADKLEIYNDIMTAFGAVSSGEDPFESENFNAIMNSIIIGDELATTEETDMLKSAILMQMGYSNPDNIGLMTQADKDKFIELMT